MPGAGAAVTATIGVDSTVNPAGIKSVAADASESAAPMLLCAVSAAAFEADSMVISRRTEAAVTLRDTELCKTPATEAKLLMMASWTVAV